MRNNSSHPSLCVIIAALNEEEGIGPTLNELKSFLSDATFVVVDGNSTDRTAEIAKEMGADVLFQERSGKGDAIAQAIKHINLHVNYAIFTDADFTYPAKYLPEMIQILELNPEVGMVTGNRFNRSFKLSPMMCPYYLGNRFLAFAHRLLNGVNLKDPLTGLRVVRWEILEKWQPKSRDFDIEAEMNNLLDKLGYQIAEFPIHYRIRLGEKKLKPKHGFTILRRMMSIQVR